MEPKTIFLSLDDVTMDKACQPRAAIDEAVVAEYLAEMIAEAQFPPVIVYFDGAAHWLADGYHRVHAARRAGFTNVLAEVRAGTRRDAVLHACGANRDHGLRRTNADKRRAVETLFSDAEWKVWSDETIAKHCGTSREFVTRLRPRVTSDPITSEARRYTTKHGTEATMNVSNIGKRGNGGDRARRREVVRQALKTDPAAPNTLIAKRLGCNPELVRIVRQELGLPQGTKLLMEQGVERQIAKFAETMNGLQGFVLGLKGLPTEELAHDARAGRWVEQLTELIAALRAVRGALTENGGEA